VTGDARRQLRSLLSEGRKFTWRNFSLKENGYPSVLTSSYSSWRVRVESVIAQTTDGNAYVMTLLRTAPYSSLIGNGPDTYEAQMEAVFGAIDAAINLLPAKSTSQARASNRPVGRRVFIVHGHDEVLKQETEIFVRQIGLEPVVLHRRPEGGRTLIEKLEEEGGVDFAIVLLTPDDVGGDSSPTREGALKSRARQNVILELGYFVGRLGRQRVCAVHKATLELPTDFVGVAYKPIKLSLDEVKYSLAQELKHAGLPVIPLRKKAD
jgi:predicted nucleotide-binding protein